MVNWLNGKAFKIVQSGKWYNFFYYNAFTVNMDKIK